jgi:hypothetical protein
MHADGALYGVFQQLKNSISPLHSSDSCDEGKSNILA